MGGTSGKLHVRIKEDQEPKIPNADILSRLPDDIIHRILSFLSTIDAVRTSLLSRCWRRMWHFIPILDLSDDGIQTESLYHFLEHGMKHLKFSYGDTKPVITRFKLEMHYDEHKTQVDNWLSFIAQSHILEELVLNMKRGYSKREWYCLPPVVLNLTSLTILKLEYVKLESCFPVSLPSLKSLFMNEVHVEDEVFHNLVLACHSLERLSIFECTTLLNLQISSLSLKFFEVSGEVWSKFQVEAINLESFMFWGYWHCDFDLTCKKLTNLFLSGAFFKRPEDLDNLLSGVPLLDSLTLTLCNIFDIRHQNLKVLVLEKFDDHPDHKLKISIDAPSLISFSYYGEETLIKFSMNTPNLLEANINLVFYFRDAINMDWYTNIIDFLSYLDCCKSMSLSLRSEEALMFPEILKKTHCSPLPNLKHLKVVISSELHGKSKLRDALLWLSPCLETLSIQQKEVD